MARQTVFFVHRVRISCIEELQANFDVEDFRSQIELDKLVHWLQITGLADQASLVPKTPDDQDLENKLIAAIGLSEEQIKEYRDAKRRKQAEIEAEQRRQAAIKEAEMEAEQRRQAAIKEEEERSRKAAQKRKEEEEAEQRIKDAVRYRTVCHANNLFFLPYGVFDQYRDVQGRVGLPCFYESKEGTDFEHILESEGGVPLQIYVVDENLDEADRENKLKSVALGRGIVIGNFKTNLCHYYSRVIFDRAAGKNSFLFRTFLKDSDLVSLKRYLASEGTIRKIIVKAHETRIYKEK